MNNPNTTELSVLADQLASASSEVRRMDCPGNINADIPAMVLTDLASHALAQWGTEDAPEERAELLARLCGPLAYMFDWFKAEADGEELSRLKALTDALDALTVEADRPRFGKVPH